MSWQQWESSVLWSVIVGTFLILGLCENWWPARMPTLPAEGRWSRNGLLLLSATLLQALLFRLGPVAAAVWVADNPWGLLNRPTLPFAVQFVAAILLLDLVHYASHRLFHTGLLWRIHEVHHSDADYDVSTAARFHPLEVIIGKGLYVAAIALLSPPVSAVFFAEVLTGLFNVFVHANVTLPSRLESLLRIAFVTPDLHRAHHSLAIGDQNRNFGQTFLWWDRLWATYLPQSTTGHPVPLTGVTGAPADTTLWALIASPFRRRHSTQKGRLHNGRRPI